MPERMHVSAPASAANLGPGFDCLAVALELRNEVTIGPGDGEGVEVTVEGEGVAGRLAGPRQPLRSRVLIGRRRSVGPAVRDAKPHSVLPRPGVERCDDLGRRRRRAGMDGPGTDPLPAARPSRGPPRQRRGGAPRRADARLESSGGPAAGRLTGGCPVDFVVAVPEDELPTKLAREALPETIAHADAAYTTARAVLLVAALESGRAELLTDALDDRLHEPYRAPFVPLLGAVREPARPVAGATGRRSRAPGRRCSCGASRGGGGGRRRARRGRAARPSARGRRAGVVIG